MDRPVRGDLPYSFSVIPLFVLMGPFAAHAGCREPLFDRINAFAGHWRGGLAVSTVGPRRCLRGDLRISSLATAPLPIGPRRHAQTCGAMAMMTALPPRPGRARGR